MSTRRVPSCAATPGCCMFRLNVECNETCKQHHIVCKFCWACMAPADIEKYKDIMANWHQTRFCTSIGCYEQLNKFQQLYCVNAACQQKAIDSTATPKQCIPPASSRSSTPGVETASRGSSSRSPRRRYRDSETATLLQMQENIMKEIEHRLLSQGGR